MVKDENYFIVAGWMINRLGLSGNDLSVYAIVYGFSQTDDQEFTGSAQYLADFCGISRRSVSSILSKLTKSGHLEKREEVINGVKLCRYRASNFIGYEEIAQGMKNLHRGYEETSQGVGRNFTGGYEETSHNNKEYKKEIKKEDINKPETPKAMSEANGEVTHSQIPYSKIMEMYNSICKSLPSIRGLSSDRKKHISARFNNGFTIDDFRTVFENAEASDFLAGRSGKQWSASFDWLICDKYFPKVLEGEYNKERSSSTYDDSTPKKKEPQTWHGHILQ